MVEKNIKTAEETKQIKPVEKVATKSQPKLKNWYANRYQMVLVQRNILLIFTLASMIAVTVAVIFVKNIMSSKSLEPYVIEVEKKTGVPIIVEQMTAQNLTGDEMIKKYFINEYIHASSGYDPKTYKMDAEKIRLFSTSAVYLQYKTRVNAKDLGPNSKIEVRIKSVQFSNQNTAQIRLVRRISKDGYDPVDKDEIITMNFYFADIQLTSEERFINPLGFQVSNYLIAEEVFNY